MKLLTLRYPSGIGVLTGVRSRQVLRKESDAPDVHSSARERYSGLVGSGLRTRLLSQPALCSGLPGSRDGRCRVRRGNGNEDSVRRWVGVPLLDSGQHRA